MPAKITIAHSSTVNEFHYDICCRDLSGILTGTKTIDATATFLVSLVPHGHATYLPAIVGVTSMPLSLVFTPDAYYFGVLPIFKRSSYSLLHGSFGNGKGCSVWANEYWLSIKPVNSIYFCIDWIIRS